MRKLVFILIAFIAAVTFIRALDDSALASEISSRDSREAFDGLQNF
jgi:hypothetical protein